MPLPVLSKDLLESIPDACALFSQDLSFLYGNEKFLALSGYTSNILEQRTFKDLFANHEISNNSVIEEFWSGKNASIQSKYDFLGISSVIPVRISMKKVQGFLLVLVIPLADLVLFDKTQVDFISTVSHELRTPLTSIRGFADTLLKLDDKVSKDQVHRFLSIIKDQAERLSRLVENILQVSRLESHQHRVLARSLSLLEPITKIIQTIQIKDHFKHKFYIDIPEKINAIWGDPDHVEQIFLNLIDNAVKYSPQGSDVRIKAYNEGSNVIIKIIDKGVGLPADKLNSIFRKFSRIHNPMTQEVEGTGLGLFITKNLVENLQGTIAVDSKEGEGSIFTVSLLAAKSVAHPIQEDI